MTMKFVVTGTPGDTSCRTSRSATKLARSSSEEKRRKSSCWVGLRTAGAVRGGSTSAKSAYRWLQKAVPHASFRPATSWYRASSQVRNAAALTSQ